MPRRCLVVGTGKMGLAHLQALGALRVDAIAAWAPSEKRKEAVLLTGAQFLGGTLDEALRMFRPSHVVIASPVQTLVPVALVVLSAGVRNVLIEKPAALTTAEGQGLAEKADAHGARICVGYNRRFYCSVRTALSRIRERSERIESVLFDFSEVHGPAGPEGHTPGVRERWLTTNTLHLIDTALFPVGRPDLRKSLFATGGSLLWHPSGSVFTGSGETDQGVHFAYHANWRGPGRWGIEWVTPSARYVFRPLEELTVMHRGSSSLERLCLDDDLDRRFKPGVYLQNQAFLDGNSDSSVPDLRGALAMLSLGEIIGAYPTATAVS